MSEVHREPPKPKMKTPAYAKIQPLISSSSMFTPMSAKTMRMAMLSKRPNRLSMGFQTVD